ncbi:MAG TPA: thiamine phosphate synthase [Cytophagaceae bacterium]|jgi:thiamine-phosphate pyrophosphorylase|nr:thiamine phosphate synthase [Cytophagaceae bacterium]
MKISRLQYISQETNDKTHAQLVEEACKAGVDWVQLRVKQRSYEEVLIIAHEVKKICHRYHAKLIINDYAAIAKEIEADGVHLGKDDMDPAKARQILGDKIIIGGTSNTIEDIHALRKAGVDYIGLGPYQFTTTKEKLSPVLGLEGYKTLMEQCAREGMSIPVIAIGGIRVEDVPGLMQQGLYGVAISSLINTAFDKKEIVKLLNSAVSDFKNV